MKQRRRNNQPPKAPGAHDPQDLPHALTFFLTAGERRAVLNTLRTHGRDRASALLKALRIHKNTAT